MHQLEEARPLLEEALKARRETLGDCHPNTMTSIYNLASLLWVKALTLLRGEKLSSSSLKPGCPRKTRCPRTYGWV